MRNDWIEARLKELPGKSKAGLARAMGLPFARISEMIKGTRKLRAEEVPAMAGYLGLAPDDVLNRLGGGQRARANGDEGWHNPAEPIIPEGAMPVAAGSRDLPIYGAAECGPDGRVGFDHQGPVDWTWRAPELLNVKGAFAIYATGDSMGDAIPEGSIVQIHPHRGPLPGRKCLVMLRGKGAFLKIWVGRRGDKVIVRQTNPPQEITWDAAEVQAVYRVVAVVEG